MARGLILRCSPGRATCSVFKAASFTGASPPKCYFPLTSRLQLLHPQIERSLLYPPPSTRCFCSCTPQQYPMDISRYKEVFSRRMAMAGIKPHHRIALGVSGGPDSIALCVLAAAWKVDALGAIGGRGSFVDGLTAIVVDHGLRLESKDEANMVHNRVSEMGIRCEITRCDWLDGRPKQGHLQEAARDMRYENFQKVCIQNQIGVLLIAHHMDDQAELFILRLSRNSGVLGLAGMPFTSQLFHSHSNGDVSRNHGILLVRPLLEFSKEDMYRICQGSNQEWVEDPTNQSPLFARNRIRMSLRDFSSSIFRSELQAIISACRETRSYVDHICHDLINKAVEIVDVRILPKDDCRNVPCVHGNEGDCGSVFDLLTFCQKGYAIVDLKILNPTKVEDICLAKFVALVLQFVSQRHRQIRGGASKLLLDYFRTAPCKTSLTAAGCYLCPCPGSKGTKALVCCSVHCPQPSRTELFSICSYGEQNNDILIELQQITANGKSYSDKLVPNPSKVPFLAARSESVLTEAIRLNIVSDATYKNILSLQREETKHFKSKTDDTSNFGSKHESTSMPLSEPIQSGQVCYFMSRFLVSWKLEKEHCVSCLVGCDMVSEIRHMLESDWLYLAKLSKCQYLEQLQQQGLCMTEQQKSCLSYAIVSAQEAVVSLKSIPAAARKSLPVLVNHQGLLLSIPSISFRHCPCLAVSAEFKPKVPLGGGHSTFI